ncbi:autolysin [Streptococcus pneumoniae]|nr:autolysin [Streptococcus pneumoniae]
MDIDRNRLRTGLPQVGVQPYRQVHAHSTGNRNSTVQNEADYHYRKDPELGFFSHVVGNGRVMQVGPVNNGSWDVGGGWNTESYAAVELIESHSTKEEFMTDYRLYIELLRNLADEAGLPKTLDTDWQVSRRMNTVPITNQTTTQTMWIHIHILQVGALAVNSLSKTSKTA